VEDSIFNPFDRDAAGMSSTSMVGVITPVSR